MKEAASKQDSSSDFPIIYRDRPGFTDTSYRERADRHISRLICEVIDGATVSSVVSDRVVPLI